MKKQKTIPLFKVSVTEQARENVQQVLKSGYISQGKWVEKFEQILCSSLDFEAQVTPLTVSSGTAALDLALHLAGVGPGSYVISTPLTCTASNSVIVNRGAKILWSDITEDGLIDHACVAKIMQYHGRDVRAIMAVNWGGAKPRYGALKRFGVPVIEDAAHCFPDYKGNSGDYTCYSFQAIKFLTTGDGGALVVSPQQYARAKRLRWFGLDRDETARDIQRIDESGYKYHMNDIAAAMGCGNIAKARAHRLKHQLNARVYDRLLSPLVCVPHQQPDGSRADIDSGSDYWIYVVRFPTTNHYFVRDKLREKGIESAVVHDRNDKHPAFQRVASAPFPLVRLNNYANEQLALPVGWWVTYQDIEYIAKTVNALV